MREHLAEREAASVVVAALADIQARGQPQI
jgi:hypothetical protein